VGDHLPLGREQRRAAPAAGWRSSHVRGDDAVQETRAIGARSDDELAPGVGQQQRAPLQKADVRRGGHFVFIARRSRSRTARRRWASANRRRSTALSGCSGGTGRGCPSSSTPTKVRYARVVWRRLKVDGFSANTRTPTSIDVFPA